MRISTGKFIGRIEDVGAEPTKNGNWRVWCRVTPLYSFDAENNQVPLDDAEEEYIDTYLYKANGSENTIATKQLQTAFPGFDGRDIESLTTETRWLFGEVHFEVKEDKDRDGKPQLRASFPFPEFRKKASRAELSKLSQMRQMNSQQAPRPARVEQPTTFSSDDPRPIGGQPEPEAEAEPSSTTDDLPF